MRLQPSFDCAEQETTYVILPFKRLPGPIGAVILPRRFVAFQILFYTGEQRFFLARAQVTAI
ncbi:MAG TPA: hypothetical protein VNR65_01645, partial [Geobacterales bacterium]|nr:hypothetical protein [Geobacterales bacterium]